MTDPTAERPDPRDALFVLPEGTAQLGRMAGRASVFTLAVSVLKAALQIGGIAIIARLVPPAEYGIFAMAIPGVMLAMAVSNFGLPQAVIQKRHITHGEVTTLFWFNIAFGLAAGAVIAALSGPAAAYYDEPQVAPVFRVIGLAVLLSAVAGQYQAILRRTMRIRAVETASLASEVIALAIAVAAALAGLSYWALVLQAIAAPASQVLLMALVTRWLPSGPHRVRLRTARESLIFGGFIAGYSILNKVSRFLGTVVIGGILGATAAGLFNRAQTLGMLPTRRIIVPLSGVFIPTLSRLQDEPGAQRRMFLRLLSRVNILIMPLAVLLAVGASPLVEVMLGRDWLATAPLLAWMSLYVVRTGIHGLLQHALIAWGHSRDLFFYGVFRVIAITLVLVWTSQRGLETMTAGYVLVDLIVALPALATIVHLRTPIGWRLLLRGYGPDLVLSGLVAGGMLLWLVPMLPELPVLAELFILSSVIGAIYGLRILLDADLRDDVMRALWKRVARKR